MSNMVIINIDLIFNWIFINFCKSMHISMISYIGFLSYQLNEQENSFKEFYCPIHIIYDPIQMLCDSTLKRKSIFDVDIMHFKWLYDSTLMNLILALIYLLLVLCVKCIPKQIIGSGRNKFQETQDLMFKEFKMIKEKEFVLDIPTNTTNQISVQKN
eukprot:UN03154